MKRLMLLLLVLLTGCASLRSDPEKTEGGLITFGMVRDFYAAPATIAPLWTKAVGAPIVLLEAPFMALGLPLEAWGNHDKVGQALCNGYSCVVLTPVEAPAFLAFFLMLDGRYP